MSQDLKAAWKLKYKKWVLTLSTTNEEELHCYMHDTGAYFTRAGTLVIMVVYVMMISSNNIST